MRGICRARWLCLAVMIFLAGCQAAITPSAIQSPLAETTTTLPAPVQHTRATPLAITETPPAVLKPSATPLPESLEELARGVHGKRLVEWVELPAIRVRAPVRPVGWSAESVEDLPEWDNPEAEVGWVVSSALPGDAGNIILYGHNNIHSSVFLRLSEMQPGDEIALTTGEGEWRYRVKEVRILEIGGEEADQRAYQQYLQPGEEALLTLLSCWPPDNNTHRVIVKALPESDAPNR